MASYHGCYHCPLSLLPPLSIQHTTSMDTTTTTLKQADVAADGLVSVTEACRLLSVGRTTLYALIKAGKLPSGTIGSSRRLPRRAVVDYARSVVSDPA